MVGYHVPRIVTSIVVGQSDAWAEIIPTDSTRGNPRRDNFYQPRLPPGRIRLRRLLAFDQCQRICDSWRDRGFCELRRDFT